MTDPTTTNTASPPPAPDRGEIAATARTYLADLDRVLPKDGDELRIVDRERGWVEAIRHFVTDGLLTPAGLEEAWKILAAGGEWLRELKAEEPGGPPAAESIPPNVPLWRVAEAHCVIQKYFAADFLASAWYKLAPLPTGQWAVQYGAWCQGVGTVDQLWALKDSRAACVWAFLTAVTGLLEKDLPRPLGRVQEKARRKLVEKLRRHGEEVG
ncbi:MAG: hypothetical protein U0871_01245 [Gemmataceae bacterium]